MKLSLSPSSMKDWQNCNRLYGWRKVELLRPVDRESQALVIGYAGHKALETFYSDENETEMVIAATNALQEKAPKISTFDTSYDETQDTLIRVLKGYLRYWGQSLWNMVARELEFEIPVDSEKEIYLNGRIDGVAVQNNQVWIVDYKFLGKLDPRRLAAFEMDNQLTAYIYGYQELSGKVVAGAKVDIAVKTKVPQYIRETYLRTKEQLQEFKEEFIEVASAIQRQFERVASGENWKTVFPKNTDHCFRYGTPCPFRDLCLNDTPIRRLNYERVDPVEDSRESERAD